MFEKPNPAPALNNPILAKDSDPTETAEWLDALELVFRVTGGERAEFILSALDRRPRISASYSDVLPFGPYRNTIPLEKQGRFPGDLAMETRITAIMRWNALAMVVRAKSHTANSEVMSPVTRPPPRYSSWGSIIFSAGPTAATAGMCCIFNRTRPRASTLALSSKGG